MSFPQSIAVLIDKFHNSCRLQKPPARFGSTATAITKFQQTTAQFLLLCSCCSLTPGDPAQQPECTAVPAHLCLPISPRQAQIFVRSYAFCGGCASLPCLQMVCYFLLSPLPHLFPPITHTHFDAPFSLAFTQISFSNEQEFLGIIFHFRDALLFFEAIPPLPYLCTVSS